MSPSISHIHSLCIEASKLVSIIVLIIIIIIIKSLFQEGNTISTKLISLAALKYIQTYTN